tara:strand:- start:143 stop:622 length:480 start_codon:yes stop_codon:yes gene_type:complete
MEELQRKIAAREKTDEEKPIEWTTNHDLLYTLLCISFFADQEIDESEKNAIFESYKMFVPSVDNNAFNRDFGYTTEKFIELNSEKNRQEQFDDSLIKINELKDYNEKKLKGLVQCYIDIANADDFIHENEVVLIQHAINIWSLDIKVEKPKAGEKLTIS